MFDYNHLVQKYFERMNKALVVSMTALFLATAATPKEEPFSVASFFEGSWIIAKRTINLDSGDVIGEPEFVQYNVTKSDETEYDIYPLEKDSFRRSLEANQIVMIPSSSLSCEIKEYSSEVDNFETLITLNFIPMLPKESFVGNS